MHNELAKTVNELSEIKDLVTKKTPSHRQAYSDRTAWLMASLSELAYVKFNPLLKNRQKEFLLDRVTDLIKDSEKKILISLIESFSYDHEEEKKRLVSTLVSLDLQLEETFDESGTQAILVLSKTNNVLILAFRGTESNSIKDIKSDAKAKTTGCESGGKVHSGFKEAYEQVAIEIQKTLNLEKYEGIPLFISGHSLGGALATIAAKRLTHKAGIAACYTFGSPRVGDEDWMENIKTPIYRLVNAADCVTMMPPGADVITAVSWVAQYLPYVGKTLRALLLRNFSGYMHCGNMRFLTDCQTGQYADVKLLYSVNLLRRLKGFIVKKLPWKHFLADHSITVYRKKLCRIAQVRN
ncbi:MAG: lipase family protein [Kiritimatiellae bacterium]|jgi:triacylglycerol lipase|nr:lipase family protein [Kiritimatiellia bacterium]